MNRKDVIEVLEMENDLITFDPATGEDIDVRCLNELNNKCYIAHEEAIEFLKQSIPIEWIDDYIKRRVNIDGIYAEIRCIGDMIKEWEKENENI